ncbi:MAG: GNAT family N-acetyltransferase [Bacteroidetes bacterium]|nr:GNAT family N-acetyltransferase [Bacteroidota bacterium]
MIKATKNDIPAIVEILTPPFSTNQSVNRCVKQDRRRLQRIENQIRYASKVSIKNNMAYINNTKTGAVLCNLSNGKQATVLDDLYFLIQVSGLRLGLQLIVREKLLKQIHPKTDYCHLWYIGVETASQGKGIGTKMIEYVKQICREKNLPIHLETSNTLNFKYYEKNGFILYRKIKLPMDDFELYFYSWDPF